MSTTAAHCIHEDYTAYFALVGRYNIADDSETNWLNRTMSAVHIHDDYDDESTHFRSKGDIAIFRMATKVDFGQFIQPVCLPSPRTSLDFVHGSVAGYGHRDSRESTPRQADLRTVNMLDCVLKHGRYAEVVSDASFCAGNPMAVPCLSDGGSGFFAMNTRTRRFEALGVVSHEMSMLCSDEDFTVFTDVTKYIAWIHESKQGYVWIYGCGFEFGFNF
jgi:secreted trypsin-like serine protease